MTTLVGTQTHFSDAIKALIELDYDAAEAYEAAIERLDSKEYRDKIEQFRQDHLRHIRELSTLLRKHNEEPPTGPDMTKHYIAKGKVIIANLLGDETILSAMYTNEEDTNTAYNRVNDREDMWDDAKTIIRTGLEDEKRHKKWLESMM